MPLQRWCTMVWFIFGLSSLYCVLADDNGIRRCSFVKFTAWYENGDRIPCSENVLHFRPFISSEATRTSLLVRPLDMNIFLLTILSCSTVWMEKSATPLMNSFKLEWSWFQFFHNPSFFPHFIDMQFCCFGHWLITPPYRDVMLPSHHTSTKCILPYDIPVASSTAF